MIGFVYSSLGCLICEYGRDCTALNKVSCRQSKNYDLQSVCSTCKNVEYMYRTFSVAVSVAVMLLKKGSVERFCKTKIRTTFRDSPCESVCEFLHELCVLHIFVVCARQVHVRHDPISRNFLRQFISRSLQVFRKAILSAFLLLCSHGKKNDTAMLRKFLRKVLGI